MMYESIDDAIEYLNQTLALGSRGLAGNTDCNRRETITWLRDNLENPERFIYLALVGEGHLGLKLDEKSKDTFRHEYLADAFWQEKWPESVPVALEENELLAKAANYLMTKNASSEVYTGAFMVNEWDYRPAENAAVGLINRIGKILTTLNSKVVSSEMPFYSDYWSLRDEYRWAVKYAAQFLSRSETPGLAKRLIPPAHSEQMDKGAREWALYVIGELGDRDVLDTIRESFVAGYMQPHIGESQGYFLIEGHWGGSLSPSWALKKAVLKLGGAEELVLLDNYLEPDESHNYQLIVSELKCMEVLYDYGILGGRREHELLEQKKDLWKSERVQEHFDYTIKTIEERL